MTLELEFDPLWPWHKNLTPNDLNIKNQAKMT